MSFNLNKYAASLLGRHGSVANFLLSDIGLVKGRVSAVSSATSCSTTMTTLFSTNSFAAVSSVGEQCVPVSHFLRQSKRFLSCQRIEECQLHEEPEDHSNISQRAAATPEWMLTSSGSGISHVRQVTSGQNVLCHLFTPLTGDCRQSELVSCHPQAQQLFQQRRSYSTPAGDGSTKATQTDTQAGDSAGVQLSQREKLKRAVKEYGSTVIVFHITISLASLGGFYLAVSSGIDMVGILQSIGVGEAILQSKLATGTGTFVVAYAVHKVFAPVRIGITLTATPFIVRYLRSKGILKPPKGDS